MLPRSLMPATLALMTAVASQTVGQVPSGTKVGTLNCELAPSVGFLVGSHQPMSCRYTPEGPFPPEFYEGVINTIGLDIGFTTGGVMTWAVVSAGLLNNRNSPPLTRIVLTLPHLYRGVADAASGRSKKARSLKKEPPRKAAQVVDIV
jgi:hypothetical protein